MKTTKKIFVFILFFIIAGGLSIFPRDAQAADISIDTGAAGQWRGMRSLVFTDNLTGYFFYVDGGDSDFKYVKTTDGGQTWNAGAEIDDDLTITGMMFDVWYDQWTPGNSGTAIHIWWVETADGDVNYTTLETASDFLGSNVVIFDGASAAAGRGVFVSGARARGGNLLVAFDIDAGAETGTYRSIDGGSTWGVRTNIVEATVDQLLMFPGNEADNQDMWALYQDASADALTLKMHDDSANTNSESATIVALVEETTDGTGQYGFSGSIRNSDGHLIAATHSAYDNAGTDFQVWDINGTGSITQKTAITTNIDDNYYPSVFINQNTNDIYVAYVGARDGSETLSTTTGVYYTKSTDGGTNWTAGNTAYSATASDWRHTWAPLSGNRFMVVWRDISAGTLLENYDNSVNTAPATITVSGTCVQSNQSTACSDTGSNVIRVAVNGSLQSQTDTTVDGDWSIASVPQPTAGQIVTVFIEGEASSASQAVAVTQWDSGNITGVELIEAHLTVGSSQNNTISNAELGDYDSSVSSKRTFHDNNVTTLTVDADAALTSDELYVGLGDTFQPGGTVNADDVEIFGTFTPEGNTINVAGTWDDNGTFTAGTSTVTMTGASEVIDASTFNNLTINPTSGGTITASGSFTVSGTLDVTSSNDIFSIPSGATVTHSGSTLTLGGTISGAGRLIYRSTTAFPTGGTISSILQMDATSGNQSMSQRTYGGAVEIDNSGATAGRTVTLGTAGGQTLTFSSGLSVQESGAGDVELTGSSNNPAIDIAGDLTCSSGTANNITTGSGTWFVAGNLNLTNCNTITVTGGTFNMDGSGTLTSNSKTLNNLTLSGTVTLANATHIVAGNLSLAGGTITAGSSTVTMSGTAHTITGGGQTLTNLTIDPSSAGTITMQTSNLTVSGTLTVAASDKFKIESGRTLTLSGTGTPLSVSGTFEPDDGSIVQYTGSSATVMATTFGGLTLGGTGTYTLPATNTTIKGTLTVTNNATVASGSGTLLFRAGTTQTITDGNSTPRNLGEIQVMASTSGNTLLTLGSDIKVASVTIDASQTLDNNGANTLIIQGSDSGGASPFKINGTYVPSTNGTVQYTGGSVTVAVPSSVYASLSLGGAGTYTLPASNLTLRGNLTVASGATVTKSATNVLVFAVGGGSSQSVTDNNGAKQDIGEIQISANSGNTTLTLGSGVKISSISIDASQTLNANGANTLEITGTGNAFNNNGTFAPRTGTVQYTGTTANVAATKYGNLTLGGTGTYTLPSSGTTTLLGNLAVTSGATVASGSSTLLFRAGGTQSVTDNNTAKQNLGEIAVQASTSGNTTLALGGSVRIASASVDASQTLDNGSYALTITNTANPFNINGTFTRSTGAVVFTGPGATNIPALNYYDLKIQPRADSITHTFLSGTASISNMFSVGVGSSSYTVTVTANTNGTGLDIETASISEFATLVADDAAQFTVLRHFINRGTFTNSSNTVTFEGPNTSSISGGGTSVFNNFTVTTAGKKIKFEARRKFDFTGTFTVTGADGNNVKIESTASGSKWSVDFANSQSAVTYATITDSGCANSADVTLGVGMVDGGNNGTCWFINPQQGAGQQGGGGGSGIGGGSGGGSQQGGGGQSGGGGASGSGGSGGGTETGGGEAGGGGGASPVIFSWWY